MQGNAGAISGCIVESVNNLCISKDVMALKSVCNELAKRIPNIDIVMQYAQPSMLLMPLILPQRAGNRGPFRQSGRIPRPRRFWLARTLVPRRVWSGSICFQEGW